MSRVLPVLLLLLVGATGIGLALQALAPATKDTAPTTATPVAPGGLPQGHLYTGITEEPKDYNPFTSGSSMMRSYVLGFTHDSLIDLDPQTAEPRPALAASWQLAADGMSMTVELRQGVRFSDGAPLGVDDVLFTAEVARCKDVVLGSLGEGLHLVAGAERLPGEPPRLRIAFDRRYFAAVQVIGQSWIVVEKRWWLQRIAELAARDGVPAPAVGEPGFGAMLARLTASPGPGTGPYMFDGDDAKRPSWRRGRDLTLRRNPHSWQRQAEPGAWNLDGVRHLFIVDGAARHAALVQRSVDWFTGPDLGKLLADDAGLAADYQRFVYDKPNYGAILVEWNTQRPQLQDPRVRSALAMLFDREQIVASIFGGVGRPALAFGKPDRPGYPHDLEVPPCDPAAIRRALRAVGFAPENDKPLRLQLLVPAEVPWYRQIGELAAAVARAAGIDLELHVVLFKELLERMHGTEWDGALLQINMPTGGDPYEFFHSKGGRNDMHWSNAEADRLLEAQRIESDPQRRAALLEQFHHIVAQEQPCALLFHPMAEVLLNKHLQGVELGALGLWPERFWMPKEFQRAGP